MSVTFIVLIAVAIILTNYSRRNAFARRSVIEEDSVASDAVFEKEAVDEKPSYFTYESDSAESEPAVYNSKLRRQEPVVVTQPVAEEAASRRFDLRQAVISQVILNNPYNREINQ